MFDVKFIWQFTARAGLHTTMDSIVATSHAPRALVGGYAQSAASAIKSAVGSL